jgi:hypothetical protein
VFIFLAEYQRCENKEAKSARKHVMAFELFIIKKDKERKKSEKLSIHAASSEREVSS